MEKIQGESIVRQSSVELKENERIDDLQRNGYKIIQNRDKFCFGMDAVLLSGFAQVRPGERVIDLGTGTGIIPILLEARYEGESDSGRDGRDGGQKRETQRSGG